MSKKVGSFLFTLAIIAWEVLDIIHGRTTVLTWVALGFFSLVGLFELGMIFEEKNKPADADANKPTAEVTIGNVTEEKKPIAVESNTFEEDKEDVDRAA